MREFEQRDDPIGQASTTLPSRQKAAATRSRPPSNENGEPDARPRRASLPRVSARTLYRPHDAVRKVAADARLEISAHVLRHTCLTNLVRGGEDLVMVAELAGHRRLDTTRRYSLPSQADRQAAMDRLETDY
jgi:integrase